MKNLREFKKNVKGCIGGMNSNSLYVFDEKDLSIEDVMEMEDYGDGFLYEYNEYLDMVMVSNVEGDFVLFYNGEDLSNEDVDDIVMLEGDRMFFDCGMGSKSEKGYKVLSRYDVDSLLEGIDNSK